MYSLQIKLLLTFGFFLLQFADSRPADVHEQGLLRHRRDASHLGSLSFHKNGIINEACVPLYDCEEIFEAGYTKSGLYRIDPGGRGDFTVFCDMNLRGGGWTVIQRRVSGSEAFDRKWRLYRNGFGDFGGNFWLGLNKIQRITDMTTYDLYIGLEDHYHHTAWALYESFSLGSEANHYKLHLGNYSDGTAGDSLATHRGRSFSTIDRDNDLSAAEHCSERHKGGWWYKDCHDANLNGVWYANGYINSNERDGIIWEHWRTEDYSLKTTVMAIRTHKY